MSGITATDLCECCHQPLPKPVYELGRVRLEVAGMRVFVDGKPVQMRPQLYHLLECMIRRPGMAFYSDALAEVMDTDAENEWDLVKTRMCQLRRALGDAATIETVIGQGAYRLVPPGGEVQCS